MRETGERIEGEKRKDAKTDLFTITTYTTTTTTTTGEMHGTGKLLYGNGDFYEGGFADNRRQGRGLFRETDGSVYTG